MNVQSSDKLPVSYLRVRAPNERAVMLRRACIVLDLDAGVADLFPRSMKEN